MAHETPASDDGRDERQRSEVRRAIPEAVVLGIIGALAAFVFIILGSQFVSDVLEISTEDFRAKFTPLWLHLCTTLAAGLAVSAHYLRSIGREAKLRDRKIAARNRFFSDTDLQNRIASHILVGVGKDSFIIPGTITGVRDDSVLAVLAVDTNRYGWVAVDELDPYGVVASEVAQYDDSASALGLRPVRRGTAIWSLEFDIETPIVFTVDLDDLPNERAFAILNSLEDAYDLIGNLYHGYWSTADPTYPRTLDIEPPPERRLIRDHQEAEELVAEWVRYLGWRNAECTVMSGDGGIDVSGTGPRGSVAVQVKFEALKTGRPKLQELWGAALGAQADTALFVNSAGYTQPALEWADAVGMGLFRFSIDGGLAPENSHADQLLRQANGGRW